MLPHQLVKTILKRPLQVLITPLIVFTPFESQKDEKIIKFMASNQF
jgi:hypothetical protein